MVIKLLLSSVFFKASESFLGSQFLAGRLKPEKSFYQATPNVLCVRENIKANFDSLVTSRGFKNHIGRSSLENIPVFLLLVFLSATLLLSELHLNRPL